MFEFPISLTHSRKPDSAEKTAAWLLPGRDVEFWIRSLSRSGLPNLETQPLFPIPESHSSRAAAGLFAPFESEPATGSIYRALRFKLLGERLFVPEDSRLSYPISEAEFASLFLHDFSLLHPTIGLIGFDAADALTLPQLLSLPKSESGLWNRARIGPPPQPDKLTISVVEPPADVFEEARDDIGSKPVDSIRDAPDPRSKIDESSKPRLIEKIGKWAQAKFKQIRDRQQREIDRLLDLLEQDPDEGLRYAIPIAGDRGGRGIGDPGAKLSPQDVEFDLEDFGGGNSLSPWSVDPSQFERLLKSYREAANRELRLGRHRRAAYIFGRLLGDFQAAALALEQGGDFREAAALYQKHIGNDLAAAECLKKGGLFEEAIRVYENLGDLEAVGDLYHELGRGDDARAAWERAVDQRLAANEPLRAQQLLETKLGDPRRALLTLQAAWREGGQAAFPALREAFHLRQRYGWHEDSLKAINEIREGEPSFRKTEVLCDVAGFYGEGEVVEAAADTARVFAGLRIQQSPDQNPRHLLRLIASLEPDDLLLKRDARRFADARQQLPAAKRPPEPANQVEIRVELRVQLPFRVVDAVDLGAEVLVAGRQKKEPVFFCFGEDFGKGILSSSFDWTRAELIRKPGSNEVMAATDLEFEPMSIRSENGKQEIQVSAWPSDIAGAAFAKPSGDLWYLQVQRKELVLVRKFYHSGVPLWETHHFSSLPPEVSSTEVIRGQNRFQPMAVVDGAVFIAFGQMMTRFDGKRFQWLHLPSPVRGLAVDQTAGKRKIGIMMENGAGLARLDRGWREVDFFLSAEERPILTFLKSGFLISATESAIRAFSTENRRVEQRGKLEMKSKPVSLLPHPNPSAFRLFTIKERIEFELR